MVRNIISKESFLEQVSADVINFVENRSDLLADEQHGFKIYDLFIAILWTVVFVFLCFIHQLPQNIFTYLFLIFLGADLLVLYGLKKRAKKTRSIPFQMGLMHILMTPFGFLSHKAGEGKLQSFLQEGNLFSNNQVDVKYFFDSGWALGDFSIAGVQSNENQSVDDVTILTFPVSKKMPHIVIDSNKERFIVDLKEVDFVHKNPLKEYAVFSNDVVKAKKILTKDFCEKISAVRDIFSNVTDLGGLELIPAQKEVKSPLLQIPLRVMFYKGQLVFAIYGFSQLFDVEDLLEADVIFEEDVLKVLGLFYEDMVRLIEAKDLIVSEMIS